YSKPFSRRWAANTCSCSLSESSQSVAAAVLLFTSESERGQVHRSRQGSRWRTDRRLCCTWRLRRKIDRDWPEYCRRVVPEAPLCVADKDAVRFRQLGRGDAVQSGPARLSV